MEKYGHDVLIVHTGSKEKCSCYDPTTGSPNTKLVKDIQGRRKRVPLGNTCPYCFGTGLVSKIIKQRTRYKDARIPQSNAFMEHILPFGEFSMDAKLYYFDKNVQISEKDLIMEVDWVNGRPVYVGNGLFEVAHVDPLRYINGKINHYRVYTKGKPINKDVRAIRVIKTAEGVSYELAEKGEAKVEQPKRNEQGLDIFNLRGEV